MIEPMTIDDVPACAQVFVDTFAGAPWHETWHPDDARQRLHDFLATPRASGVCRRDDTGAVLGFAVGRLERTSAGDHFLLQEMCVRPAAQRGGHGTALLQALIERHPDVHHWYLLTLHGGEAASFYERNGFRPARRMGVYVRP